MAQLRQSREFCEKKGKDITELSDVTWKTDFVFAVDMTLLLNGLNTKLHGKGLFARDLYSLVMDFMRRFLQSQRGGQDCSPICKPGKEPHHQLIPATSTHPC